MKFTHDPRYNVIHEEHENWCETESSPYAGEDECNCRQPSAVIRLLPPVSAPLLERLWATLRFRFWYWRYGRHIKHHCWMDDCTVCYSLRFKLDALRTEKHVPTARLLGD